MDFTEAASEIINADDIFVIRSILADDNFSEVRHLVIDNEVL